MTEEELMQMRARAFRARQQQTQEQLAPESILEKNVDQFVAGVMDAPMGGGQFLYNTFKGNPVGDAVASADKWLYEKTGGIIGVKDGDVNAQMSEREKKLGDYTAARFVGNVAPAFIPWTGGVSAFSRAAGVNPVVSGAISGATGAAAAPVDVNKSEGDYWNQKNRDLTTGAVLGGGLPMVANGVRAGINRPEIQRLMEKGVVPTVGQAVGGMANHMEQALTSVPFLGPTITNARRRAMNEWNASVIDDVLAPIGGRVGSQAGRVGVREAGEMISNAYKNAAKNTPGFTLSGDGVAAFNKLANLSEDMGGEQAARFRRFLQKNVLSRINRETNGFDSETYKIIDSEIKDLASKYPGTEINGALKELQSLLRREATKADPVYGAMLDAADESWARLVRLEDAAGRAPTQGGMFTPGQMLSSIKKGDDRVRSRGFSRGEGLGQQAAEDAQAVLGDTLPNSGTADRLLAEKIISTAGVTALAANPAFMAALSMELGTTATIGVLGKLGSTRRGQEMIIKALQNTVARNATPIADETVGLLGLTSGNLME